MEAIDAAIGAANSAQLDELARAVWGDYGHGRIDDTQARALVDAIDARRAAMTSRSRQGWAKGFSARQRPRTDERRRKVRSPDRHRSLARRRQLAASGAVPGSIAVHFTIGELAALSVIAREVQRTGSCTWPMDRIAAVAGVCRTTTRNAIRLAQRHGLISVEERRIDRWRSDTNVVTIRSPEWRAWLRLRSGRKNALPTDNHPLFQAKVGESSTAKCWGERTRAPVPG